MIEWLLRNSLFLQDIFAITLPAFSLLQVLSFPAFSYFYLDTKKETHNKGPPLAIYEKNLHVLPVMSSRTLFYDAD